MNGKGSWEALAELGGPFLPSFGGVLGDGVDLCGGQAMLHLGSYNCTFSSCDIVDNTDGEINTGTNLGDDDGWIEDYLTLYLVKGSNTIRD